METHKISLEEIKVDALAYELATSEGTKPYLDCLIKAYSTNAGLEAALQVVRDLPLDLPHIPEPTRSEMTKELELRFLQLQMLLKTFHTE